METKSSNLVVYFSPQLHTKKIAEYLAEGLSADIQEIVPCKHYSERDLNWKRFFARCNRERRRKICPAIEMPEVDLSQYAVLFLGFPIWYDLAPNIVETFLRTHEWVDQKIVLFATSGGSGIENAAEDLKRYVGKEKIQGARLFDAADGPETVAKWGKEILRIMYNPLQLAASEYVKKEYSILALSARDYYSEEPDEGPEIHTEFSDVKYSSRIPEREDHYNRAEILKTLSPGVHDILRGSDKGADLLRRLEQQTNQSFAGKLLWLIRAKGLTEPAVYKSAWVDRKLFSKIICDQDYKPSKDTCVALALALHLNLEEANDLLSRAGYTFSHSSRRDVILEFFFTSGNYNVYDVNIILYQMGQKPLGRQT